VAAAGSVGGGRTGGGGDERVRASVHAESFMPVLRGKFKKLG
jgi:hypothetical protein